MNNDVEGTIRLSRGSLVFTPVATPSPVGATGMASYVNALGGARGELQHGREGTEWAIIGCRMFPQL